MNSNPNNIPVDDQQIASQLAIIQRQVAALADPAPCADSIMGELDALYNGGADENALLTIQDNAATLLETAAQQSQALKGLEDIAQRLREQRDQVRETFRSLRQAVETCDTDDPLVAGLAESLQEDAYEQAEEYAQESFWEDINWQVQEYTGLNFHEAYALVGMLTDPDVLQIVPEDNPLWDELRGWIKKMEAVLP